MESIRLLSGKWCCSGVLQCGVHQQQKYHCHNSLFGICPQRGEGLQAAINFSKDFVCTTSTINRYSLQHQVSGAKENQSV